MTGALIIPGQCAPSALHSEWLVLGDPPQMLTALIGSLAQLSQDLTEATVRLSVCGRDLKFTIDAGVSERRPVFGVGERPELWGQCGQLSC